MKKKILIVTKHPKSKGGVVNYYNNFFEVFNNPNYQLQWFIVGSRPNDYDRRNKRQVSYFIELVSDLLSFMYLLMIDRDIYIVKVNPSFIKIPLIRDSLFVLFAKLFRKRTVVFIRGWSHDFASGKKKRKGYFKLIFNLLKNANVIIVLADKFKKSLVELGFDSSKITVSRTMHRQSDIMSVNNFKNDKPSFLYLGRISELKGIFDILEAFKIIRDKGIDLSIDLYGHFSNKKIEEQVNSVIQKYDLKNSVRINEFISGKDKYEVLSSSDVFVFPSYDEGCPNSIIEALASSMFIISTPVGAVDEIVLNGQHGIIVPVNSPQILAKEIIWCHQNFNLIRSKAIGNAEYAKANFEQHIIINQMVELYDEIQ